MKASEPKNIAPIMFGLMLSLFLSNLDQTIIATCLSAIARDLQGWELLPWVISAYLITSTATAPIYGRLSDSYGRRPVMLASIAIFMAASVLCALADTMPLLIAARALQGIGGGGLRSISQVVIADIIPPSRRGIYQGYMSTTFLISTTLGPVLGGFFAEHLSWTWAFWINIPLGLIAFLVIERQLRKLNVPVRRHKIDWMGALLILAASVPVLVGLSRVEQEGGWLYPSVLVPIFIGVAATLVLVRLELRLAEPMLPMWLFANRIFTWGTIAICAPTVVMTALIILVPLYYQTVLGWSADKAGLQLIAFTGGMAIGSFVVGSAIARLGRARIFPIIAGLVMAALCLLIAHHGFGRSLLFDVTCTFGLGFAIGCQVNPLMVIVPNGLALRDIGAGISGLTFFRSLSSAFGVAIFTTFLIQRLAMGAMRVPGHEALGPDPGVGLLRQDAHPMFDAVQLAAFKAVTQEAFSAVFVLAAGITLVAVVALLMIKERPLRTHTREIDPDV